MINITIKRKVLANELGLINGFNQKTILSSDNNATNFNVISQNNNLYLDLSFSNTEVSFWRRLTIDGEGEGEFNIQTKNMFSFINSDLDADISLIKNEETKNSILIKTSGYKVNISESKKESFLVKKEEEFPLSIKLTAGEMSDIIKKVSFCIEDQKFRQNLMGMNVSYYKGQWYFVGSDSFRINVYKKQLQSNIKEDDKLDSNFIIAKRNLDDILKIVSFLKEEEEIEMLFDERRVVIRTKDIYFKSLLVSEKYPDITKFYDNKGQASMRIDTKEISNDLRIFKNSADSEQQEIKLDIKSDKVAFIYEGNIEKIEKELDCEYSAKELKIHFNVFFLAEALQNMDQEKETVIEFTGGSGPAVIKNEGVDHYRHILMPLRIN
ncbi:MAG: hypothetical protein JJV97_00035 [SAR324 cluster bacterium]|nr:hypothetical protein [SAR324 cluster bacterium]